MYTRASTCTWSAPCWTCFSTAVELPARGFASNHTYLKIRDRLSYAFALVSVAAGLELDGGRIKEARFALGGVGHRLA